MRPLLLGLAILVSGAIPCLFTATAQAPAGATLTAADRTAAFTAAGFNRVGRQWQGCGDPGTASYTPGEIETVRDIDGDGRPDAVITEGSTYCYGNTGTGFSLVSKQGNGTWRLIHASPGIARFLPRSAAIGWPDLEIGGPGFCFPVARWNGRKYLQQRFEHDGKPCRPPR
jgi:hypothetical protein